jgi:hypothetical protein
LETTVAPSSNPATTAADAIQELLAAERAGISPTSEAKLPAEEQHSLKRQRTTAFWLQQVIDWDWFPIVERAKKDVEFSAKLGSRRSLMESTGITRFVGMAGPQLWHEEYCFDEAVRLVAETNGLELTIDKHVFWIKIRQ